MARCDDQIPGASQRDEVHGRALRQCRAVQRLDGHGQRLPFAKAPQSGYTDRAVIVILPRRPTGAQPTLSTLVVRGHAFHWGRQTYIMAILNATPDSFSGDGLVGLDSLRHRSGSDDWVAAAVEQGRRFVAEGAHILDVGGESTRPGSQPVNVEEELRRVIPLIEGLAGAVDVPISIDTSKAAVAAAALRAGASMVNDVWGLRLDPPIAQAAAEAGAPVILMHNRSQRQHVAIDPALGGRYVGTAYSDLLGDIAAELQISIDLARRAGIPASHIILDGAVGPAGRTAQPGGLSTAGRPQPQVVHRLHAGFAA